MPLKSKKNLTFLNSALEGLVPCKIIDKFHENGHDRVTVRYTASRGPYVQGDTDEWPAKLIVERDQATSADQIGEK